MDLSNFFGLDQNFSDMSQVVKLRSENVVYELFERRPSYFGQTDFGPRDYILQYKRTGHEVTTHRCQNIHLVPKLFDRYR